LEGVAEEFIPDHGLTAWLVATFIDEKASLANPDHAHLERAKLGCVWTNTPNSRGGRAIVGQCERMPPQGSMGKWQRARAVFQVERWFGFLPDFLLTFDAGYSEQCDDASWCALAEHELYHAGQEIDAFGMPKFSRSTGLPVFAIKAHDVEEFVGVVRRYGAEASNAATLIEAAKRPPELAMASIAGACGTCLRAAA
jgi:hypothetical protein